MLAFCLAEPLLRALFGAYSLPGTAFLWPYSLACYF